MYFSQCSYPVKPILRQIPVCIYHGTPSDRVELRRTVMLPSHLKSASQSRSKFKGNAKPRAGRGPKKRTGKPVVEDSDEEPAEDDPYASFPIIVTTYDMIIKDRLHLAKYDWGYIVVDEGHRLKNLNCKLMQEIKKYPSAGRMILTGTPLHVSM